jgi:HAD superfamily hydrolase (TIGR01549 family)
VAIETVLLDAGGVLVFPNWQRISEIFARHGISVSADDLQAADPHARFAIDDARGVAGTSDADRGSRYFRLMFQRAGIAEHAPIDGAVQELWTYHSEHNLWEYIPEDVVPALERLSDLGVRMAVASNANGTLHRMFDRVGLSRHFDAVCDSCVEGVEKPDPRFFRIVLERAGGRPETSIHVGDLYHVDVVGARNTGIRPILFDPAGLYGDYDVERVRSLDELVNVVAAG